MSPPAQERTDENVAATIDAAAARCEYRLTYDATEKPRELHSSGIDGPSLPNAYYVMGGASSRRGFTRSKTGSGAWDDPDHSFLGPQTTEDDHIDRWALAVVSEAVHESLEWFWVDGKPWLDPHGDSKSEIHDLCAELAHSLAKLREKERES